MNAVDMSVWIYVIGAGMPSEAVANTEPTADRQIP